MDHAFDDVIDTLLAAQTAVREMVEAQASRPVPDSTRLQHFDRSVRSLAQQTDSLLVLMVERHAPEPLLDKVENLSDIFHEAKRQIEGLLAAQRRHVRAPGPV
jgi:hypothetical protein